LYELPEGDAIMDQPLDLRRLAQFVAVTDNESLTAAASHLNVTQQALSSAIANSDSSELRITRLHCLPGAVTGSAGSWLRPA